MQLGSLVSLLGYEDEEEAAVWCECHGLPLDPQKSTVKFDRSSFVEMPEKFPSMRRSSIIESKRTSSISKCIAKSLVPEDPTLHHTPLNSFDSNGVLLQEAWLAEDHEELVTALAPQTRPPIIKSPSCTSILPNLIENISIKIRSEIVNTTVNDIVREIALQAVIKNAQVRTSHRIFKQFLDDFMRYSNYEISIYLLYYLAKIVLIVRDFCAELVGEIAIEMRSAKYQEQHKLDLEHKVRLFCAQVSWKVYCS